jgi:hypothetical protein
MTEHGIRVGHRSRHRQSCGGDGGAGRPAGPVDLRIGGRVPAGGERLGQQRARLCGGRRGGARGGRGATRAWAPFTSDDARLASLRAGSQRRRGGGGRSGALQRSHPRQGGCAHDSGRAGQGAPRRRWSRQRLAYRLTRRPTSTRRPPRSSRASARLSPGRRKRALKSQARPAQRCGSQCSEA